MANVLEVEVSASLSEMRDTWFIKIPDSPFGTYTSRPFDFICISKGIAVGIECKQCRSRTSFPLANIQPHQIVEVSQVEFLGGRSCFLINMRATKGSPRSNKLFALTPDQIIHWYYIQSDRSSIPVEWMIENCIELDRIKIDDAKYGWDMQSLFSVL